MNKITITAIAIILAAFGGLIAWTAFRNAEDPTNLSNYDSTAIIGANDANGNIADHVRGKEDSKVVLVEYADLQCPGCAAAMPNIHKIYEDYGDRVAFIFRNYPVSGHQNARAAAAAAESAGFQGYFWEMIETIYANRADWISESGSSRTAAFVSLFKDIAPEGDVEKFEKDMNNSAIETKISFDQRLGREVDKINATPAFLVNGRAIDVSKAETQEDLKKQIEALLNEELAKVGEKTGAKSDSEE